MTEADRQRKSRIRAEMRARLDALTAEQRHDASVAACARLTGLESFRVARVVMLYMPLATEVDLTPAAIRCFQSRKTVCVPSVDWARKDMRPVEVTSFDDDVMDLDEHGLRVPRQARPVLPELVGLVVVPGLAFDVHGARLGRGGGFYDRFLQRLHRSCVVVGLAFDAQIIDEVPVQEHDIRMDVVVTDRRVSEVRRGVSGRR